MKFWESMNANHPTFGICRCQLNEDFKFLITAEIYTLFCCGYTFP